jgi:hypothetical protein
MMEGVDLVLAALPGLAALGVSLQNGGAVATLPSTAKGVPSDVNYAALARVSVSAFVWVLFDETLIAGLRPLIARQCSDGDVAVTDQLQALERRSADQGPKDCRQHVLFG